MPYLLSVKSGKERVVKAILAERNIDCKTPPPPLSGFLISEVEPPIDIKCLPHILMVTETSKDQANRLMTVKIEQKVHKGMRVTATRGAYVGYFGIVREANCHTAMVDFSVYGKMVAVSVLAADLEQS